MIEAAGGEALLGRAGAPSHPTTWDEVVAADPELVVIAPCGFGVDEAVRRCRPSRPRAHRPERPRSSSTATPTTRAPAPRLADGVRQLGHLLHPEAVPDPGLPVIELPVGSSQLRT